MAIHLWKTGGAPKRLHQQTSAAEPAQAPRPGPAVTSAARLVAAADLQHLQRVAGNQAVGRLVTGTLAPRQIQRVPRPPEGRLREILTEAVSQEPGSCDEATRTAFKLLREAEGGAGHLGSVVLYWTHAHEPDAHTAVRVHWDEGVFVVDTSLGQFSGALEVFVGSEAEWQAEIARRVGRLSEVEFEARPAGLLFTSPNAMFDALTRYYARTRAAAALEAEWEASAVPVPPARRGRRWRRGR